MIENPILTRSLAPRDDDPVRLGLNENPYPLPEPTRRRILAALDSINRYPLGGERRVLERAARLFGTRSEMMVITRGIDEALDRLVELHCSMRFVLFSPMFLACEARLRLMGANYTVFPLDERFRIRERDWEQLTANDFIIMDCPKNPTGSLLHDDDLERLSHVCGKLLVDEAYVEFSARQSFAPRVNERFFVFRSLSKAYGLAGQRLGFLVTDEPTATAITNRQWYCNIDHLSLALLDVILGEPFVAERTACIVRDRELVTTELRALGFEVLSSQANFILLRTPEASRLVAGLRDRGILVLDTGLFGYAGHIRVSIGTPQQNRALINALYELRSMNDGGANSV